MKKIKTFADACKMLKMKAKLPDVSMLPEDQQKSVIAFYKLSIITKALNGKWVADWNDDNQYKYYPWFKYDSASSGFVFSYVGCYYWASNASVGSRLCFKSETLAKYAATQFISIYNDLLLIK